MTAITNIDYITEGIQLLIGQYDGLPRIQAYITSLLQQVKQLDDVAVLLATEVYNLDDAIGEQLNICGVLLDVDRNGNPDTIYRRRIKTKVQVIRSQGRVEDLIKVLAAYQGKLTNDGLQLGASSGSVVGPCCINELGVKLHDNNSGTYPIYDEQGDRQQIQIDWRSEDINEYSNPVPFDPKGNHEQLNAAAGAGADVHTIWGYAPIGESPLTASLVFSNGEEFPNTIAKGTWGTIDYSTSESVERDYPTNNYGVLGNVLQGKTTFIGVLPLENITAPVLSVSSWGIGNSITVTSGVWRGLPEELQYTLYRNGAQIDGWVTRSYADINSYTLGYDDIAVSMSLVEHAVRFDNTLTASSNSVFGDIFDWDSELEQGIFVMREHDTFYSGSDAVMNVRAANAASGAFVVEMTETSGANPTLTATGTLNYNPGVYDGVNDGWKYDFEQFTTGVTDFTIFSLVAPSPNLEDRANVNLLFQYNGNFAVDLSLTGSKYHVMATANGGVQTQYVSGGTAQVDTPNLIAVRYAGSGSGGMWVDDLRLTSRIPWFAGGAAEQGFSGSIDGKDLYISQDLPIVQNEYWNGPQWENLVTTRTNWTEEWLKIYATYYKNFYGIDITTD